MKLKNKKMGKIVDVLANPVFTEYNRDGTVKNVVTFNSLAELNEEWEDYEEPKGYWFINSSGGVDFIALEDDSPEGIDGSKQIGNYFETKEEAEKAVEKMKAWKRLKDKGFKFKNWYWQTNGMHGFINFSIKSANIDVKDIELLFGGKE